MRGKKRIEANPNINITEKADKALVKLKERLTHTVLFSAGAGFTVSLAVASLLKEDYVGVALSAISTAVNLRLAIRSAKDII